MIRLNRICACRTGPPGRMVLWSLHRALQLHGLYAYLGLLGGIVAPQLPMTHLSGAVLEPISGQGAAALRCACHSDLAKPLWKQISKTTRCWPFRTLQSTGPPHPQSGIRFLLKLDGQYPARSCSSHGAQKMLTLDLRLLHVVLSFCYKIPGCARGPSSIG